MFVHSFIEARMDDEWMCTCSFIEARTDDEWMCACSFIEARTDDEWICVYLFIEEAYVHAFRRGLGVRTKRAR